LIREISTKTPTHSLYLLGAAIQTRCWGSSYEEGIRIANKLHSGEISGVTIHKTDEHRVVGDYEWVICPFVVFGNGWKYWLDTTPTKKTGN